MDCSTVVTNNSASKLCQLLSADTDNMFASLAKVHIRRNCESYFVV